MEDIIMIDKKLLISVIATLKKLDVRGFDSMDALVGCVMVLEKALNPPDPIKEEIELDSIEKENDNNG